MSKRREKDKVKSKKTQTSKQKIKAKMFAIALIFVMLFVSYVVIFSSQNNPQPSKNMVFEMDGELGTRYGRVMDISEDLSNVNLSIRDSSSDSTNTSDILEHGVVVETDGNFNCTFLDENDDGKLDEEDKFIVHNASAGDWVKLYLKSSREEVAYYIF